MEKEVMTTIINGFSTERTPEGMSMEERDIELCTAIAKIEHEETRVNVMIYACAQFEGFLNALKKGGVISEKSAEHNIAMFRNLLDDYDETKIRFGVGNVRQAAENEKGHIIMYKRKLEDLYSVNFVDE